MNNQAKCRRRKTGTFRFDVNMDVQFSGRNPRGKEIEGIGVIRNLAMRGALIETHARVEADDRLTLFLTIPNQPDLLEIPSVVVRWARGHQLGVEFLEADKDTFRQLMRYLSRVHISAREHSQAG